MLSKSRMVVFVVLSMAIIIMNGCLDRPTSTGNLTGNLFVYETDYTSGKLESMNTSDTVLSSNYISLFRDAIIRTNNGSLYILEGYGADNVLKYDPSKKDSGIIYQEHLGDNWNPQDMEFVSDTKAYISNLNEPKITVFNPSSGKIVKNIDISAYTFNPTSNSSPYAGEMVIVDKKLYVLLQRRDGFNPGAPTLIISICTNGDTIFTADTISLQYKNGYDMVYANGALYVSNPGSSFFKGDGAIEKVVLSSKTVSTIITEEQLGGNPNHIVHKSGSSFYLQNYIDWGNESVVELNASSGTFTTLPSIKDAFGGIFYDNVEEKLYVGERDATEIGVKVFKDNVLIAGPLKSANSLPPMGITMVR